MLGRFRTLKRAIGRIPLVRRAISAGRTRLVKNRFHEEPAQALAAYRRFNRGAADRDANYAPRLIELATRFGYLGWPRKIREYVHAKDLLDVGCGTGMHAIGYVTVGARSYLGVDPRVDLDGDRTRDLRAGEWKSTGLTGRDIMQAMPRVRLHPGGIESLPRDADFDVVILHNVTEHLPDLEGVFACVTRHLRPDGIVIFNHHNYYCWNGHHMSPKRVADIDPDDEAQRDFVDWGHLDFVPPPGHYVEQGLNRIRLHELRELTERYFRVVEWTARPSKPEQGAGRLTPEIRRRYARYGLEELLTQNVFCRAAPKTAAE